MSWEMSCSKADLPLVANPCSLDPKSYELFLHT